MNYYVYILKSIRYNRIYIGLSCNVENRLKQHNAGETKSTKFYRPYKIIYQEKCRNRVDARIKEKFFKSGCGREWIKSQFMGP